jgi:hypothetical protein
VSNDVAELLTPKIVLPLPNVTPFVGDEGKTPPPNTGGLPKALDPNAVASKLIIYFLDNINDPNI